MSNINSNHAFFSIMFRNSAVMARALEGFNVVQSVDPEFLACLPDFVQSRHAAMSQDVDVLFDSFFAPGVHAAEA